MELNALPLLQCAKSFPHPRQEGSEKHSVWDQESRDWVLCHLLDGSAWSLGALSWGMNIAFSTCIAVVLTRLNRQWIKPPDPNASVGILNVPSYSCAFRHFYASFFGGREIVKPTVMVNLKKNRRTFKHMAETRCSESKWQGETLWKKRSNERGRWFRRG